MMKRVHGEQLTSISTLFHDNILKFDILGHDDPTMIRKLQDLSGIDPKTIDVSDPEVMGIFSTVEALGVTRDQVDSASGTFGIPEFGTNFCYSNVR